MSETLRPCPFCGTERDSSYPCCAGCGSTGPTAPYAIGKAATWNTRPVEDELRKHIGDLERSLEETKA